MIKANGEYLDFNESIEIESQIKLFEEIYTATGDFSYSFDVAKTMKNLKILGFPYPDTIKSIYQSVPCEILDDSGFKVYTGSLQVTRVTDVIQCNFFSGNTEWFGLLDKPMTELPLFKYDVNLTVANVQASWTKDKGIVFPIIDTGTLLTRGYSNLKLEDFTGCFYAKTLMQEIFNPLGINLKGDLIEDSTYNQLIIAANTKSQGDVSDRSSYVAKSSDQSMIDGSELKITFENESVFPYYDGAKNNFVASTYTADVRMLVRVEFVLKLKYNTGAGLGSFIYVRIKKNGTIVYNLNRVGAEGTSESYSFSTTLAINAFDYLELFILQDSINIVDVQAGSTFKVTPIFIYKTFGASTVPNWTQGEFVSNILRVFNVTPSYAPESKVLTLNLFNKIKEKEPIDISDNVTITGIDFTDFVSNYGKNNIFKYQEGSDEDLREYNISNFISYGSGNLEVLNDFIENSADVVESDFTSPITYLNGPFDMSMERINFYELEEIDDKSITSVTDSSGTPRFNITDADDLFTVGDLVGIETNVEDYNGDWVVKTVTTTYIEVNGVGYTTTATGTATLLRHKFTTDDNVYMFINVPNQTNLFFSSQATMYVDNTTFLSSSMAYFNLLSNGRQINTKYKQSLSFGEVNNPLSYQLTLLDTYWGIFSDILSDPVMLTVDGYFDRNKFQLLKTFLRPLRIKTNETNNLYYLNRISGYQSGHEACEAELIKL